MGPEVVRPGHHRQAGPPTPTIDSGPDTIASTTPGRHGRLVGYAKGFFSGKGVAAYVTTANSTRPTATGWTTPAAVGDSEGSWTSASGAIGSPGASTYGTATPASVANAA